NGKHLNGIGWTLPDMVFPSTLGTTPQVLQYRRQHPRRLFERLADLREGDKQGWFCRFDQLPPHIHLTRPTVQARPGATPRPNNLPCFCVDEAMPKRPGIGAEQQGL